MGYSTFYHTCDEATSSYADVPSALDDICARLFVDHQVLQVNGLKCHLDNNSNIISEVDDLRS